jgi:hypothetical protein
MRRSGTKISRAFRSFRGVEAEVLPLRSGAFSLQVFMGVI